MAPVPYPSAQSRGFGSNLRHILSTLMGLDLRVVKNRRQAMDLLKNELPSPGLREFLCQNLVRRKTDDGQSVWEWRVNLPAINDQLDNFTHHALRGVYTGPAIFIAGGESDYIQPKHHPVIEQMFPTASVETIAGTGHWLHAEKPDEFVRIVCEFLESNKL
eukprot:818532_1